MRSVLYTLAAAWILQGIHSAQWSSTSPDVMYPCAGGSVTLLWNYTLSSGDVLGDIHWYYNGNSQEMVAIFSQGNFLVLPAFVNRVEAVGESGITVKHLTVADSGDYSVEISVSTDNGNHTNLLRSVFLQVSDHLLTQDGHLHVTQRSEPVLDTTTDQWAVQLQCGTFTFRGDPPYQVEWITPSGDVVNSSDFSDNHFNLLLANPLQGGNYTCRTPPHHAAVCLHGNGEAHVQTSFNVDKVDARLSLLEKENQQQNEQLRQSDVEIRLLKEQLHLANMNFSQVQSLQQVKGRVERLEERTRQQISFHASDLETTYPPENTPLIVNDVHYNGGNGYNGTTGYFTAPYPGVYFFTAKTEPGTTYKLMTLYLYVDQSLLGQAYCFFNRGGPASQALINSVVHLTTGQRVWLKSSGDHYWGTRTTFSGFLISLDP